MPRRCSLFDSPRRIGEQSLRRVNLARADQMREQMPQPVHVRQPVQAPATGLSEVCDKKAVKLRDSALDRTLTQQRPHDVVQAQDTAAEIEVQKQ
jgi:hypothetical protein